MIKIIFGVFLIAACVAAQDCYDLCAYYSKNCTPYSLIHCKSNDTLIVSNTVSKAALAKTKTFFRGYSIKTLLFGTNISAINDDSFSNFNEFRHYVFSGDVKTIGKRAFANSGMDSVTFRQGVNKINTEAFANCPNLSSVNIAASVSSIAQRAFFNCSNLTSVIVSNTSSYFKSENGGLISKNGTIFKLYYGKSTSYSVPEQVTTIEPFVFTDHSELTSVTLPSTLEVIDDFAFSGCSGISSISFGDLVTTIGKEAFRGCSMLSSVSFGKSVATIRVYAFGGTPITSLKLPDSLTSISPNAFSGCAKLTTLTLPNNLTFIPGDCFYNCSKLTSLTIPDSVEEISEWAFAMCDSLSTVKFSSSLKTIGGFAFAGCSMKSIELPSNLESISLGAFGGNEKLESLSIPGSVTFIESKAFAGCSKLSKVDYYGFTDPGNESANVFHGCDVLKTIIVPPEYNSTSFCGFTDLTPRRDNSAASTNTVSFAVMLALFLLTVYHSF